MNIKVPPEGMVLNLAGSGGVFISPARDIAYAGPIYVAHALKLVMAPETDPIVAEYWASGGTAANLELVARALSAWFLRVEKDPRMSATEHAEAVGIQQLPQGARQVFAVCLANVILGAYAGAKREVNAGKLQEYLVNLSNIRVSRHGVIRRTAIRMVASVLRWLL